MQIAAPIGRALPLRQQARFALLPWQSVAVCSTCAAVAFLPFLQPAGPGNVSPVAALISTYPSVGVLAVVQDLVLLGWATSVVTVCRTPSGLSLVMRTWAYASVVWALLMMLGALTNIDLLSGISAHRQPRIAHVRGPQ